MLHQKFTREITRIRSKGLYYNNNKLFCYKSTDEYLFYNDNCARIQLNLYLAYLITITYASSEYMFSMKFKRRHKIASPPPPPLPSFLFHSDLSVMVFNTIITSSFWKVNYYPYSTGHSPQLLKDTKIRQIQILGFGKETYIF